jgi:tRNA pseudouridine55 synthase
MRPPAKDGLLLLNKKPGLTSFDSLAAIKKAFATGKAGHTGTLDKFASGLLLVLVGKGVKLVPLFEDCVKEYTGTVSFGEETDTLDPEGLVIARGKVPSRDEVEAVLPAFRGDILQSPPVYSAIHVNGRRAYELSREGKIPEMKKRPIAIFELEILSWAPPLAEIRVACSSGTYIRSLARDIALAAGSRAHLSALRRTKIGVFRLEDAVDCDDPNLAEALRPLDKALFQALSLPCFFIDDEAEEAFIHGRPLDGILTMGIPPPEVFLSNGRAGVFSKEETERLLGFIERKGGKWVYGHVWGQSNGPAKDMTIDPFPVPPLDKAQKPFHSVFTENPRPAA